MAHACYRTGHLQVSQIIKTGYAKSGIWDQNENQISDEIELEANSPVLLHAAYYEVCQLKHCVFCGGLLPV